MSDQDDLLLHLAGHARARFIDEHVHLAANAELRQVNSGLNGKASPGKDCAFVVGFEVVHIRAGAMNILADLMTGAMEKVVGITSVSNMRASRVVDLESQQ